MNKSESDRLRARAKKLADSTPKFDGPKSVEVTEELTNTFTVYEVVDTLGCRMTRYLTDYEAEADCNMHNRLCSNEEPRARIIPLIARITSCERD